MDMLGSIDMVRMECLVSADDYKGYMNKYHLEPWFELHKERLGIKEYRHSFHIICGETTVRAFYCHNTEVLNRANHKLVIEFNPNKVSDYDNFKSLIKYFTIHNRHGWSVKSLDVAFDIQANIKHLIFDKVRYQNVQDFYSDGSKTTYIGKRGQNQVKIYDKKKEREDKGHVVDHKYWTRVEYSIVLKFDLYHYRAFIHDDTDIGCSFPYISFMEIDGNISPEYKAMLICLQMGLMDTMELSYHKRKKLKELADSMSYMNFDDDIKKHIFSTIVTYFDGFVQQYGIECMPF